MREDNGVGLGESAGHQSCLRMQAGEVISYLEMCARGGANLQRGMYYRLHGGKSVLLMSLRRGASYADRAEEEGRVLIYEGHDAPRIAGGPEPKNLDQPFRTRAGKLTENGLFFHAAERYKESGRPELIIVYEKIRDGIWVYNGVFELVDAWVAKSGNRKVFRFKLEVAPVRIDSEPKTVRAVLANTRLIPCQKCRSR